MKRTILCFWRLRGCSFKALKALLYVPVLVASSFLYAQTPALTTAWVAGEGSHVDDVPSFTWLENGSAILADERPPSPQQTFESLDPATGKRHPLLDMQQALASLKSLAPGEDIHGALPWPITFDRAGKRALYIFSGDIFLLDLDRASFSR
jgi:hypothetical protein